MSSKQVERRLAAVVAADVAGFSRLMSRDEEATLQTLNLHLTEVIEPAVAQWRGRLVKTAGDSVLLEFASVADAFQCALQIQELMAVRNRDVPDARRMDMRMGLNIGDILIDRNDVFGEGVNIAARLEGLAAPGGICVSDRAWEDLRRFDVRAEDLGERRLKNIPRVVGVFHVTPREASRGRLARIIGVNRTPRVKFVAMAAAPVIAMVMVSGYAYYSFGAASRAHAQGQIEAACDGWKRQAANAWAHDYLREEGPGYAVMLAPVYPDEDAALAAAAAFSREVWGGPSFAAVPVSGGYQVRIGANLSAQTAQELAGGVADCYGAETVQHEPSRW